MVEGVDEDLEQLLEYLLEARGFDFRAYKRGTLGRRIAKRMQVRGVDGYRSYQALLEAEPHEFAELFDTILINVTGFLRDREAWEYLASDVLPVLVDRKRDDEPIRAWSAGCATGEEAYSIAVLLCEALGEEAFRERVKVYGTDADEQALGVARQGRYPIKAVEQAFSQEQIERHFEPDGNERFFRKDLRRSVIFGRHDLVQDPPISRVDLLVCRNTLMYFNADAQGRILHNFHFALNEGGYLFLGKSEALVTRTNLFVATELRRHVFVKHSAARNVRFPFPTMPRPNRTPGPGDLADVAFENNPVAQIIVDRAGTLAAANRHARTLFGLGLNQIMRPFKDIELSYRPIELRSRIEQAFEDRRSMTISDVPLQLPAGTTEYLEVVLLPLSVDNQVTAVSLTFLEVTGHKVLRDELERSQRELEAAYEELQSINEELETTNEELQSTNEELETTNEELHSTNEELETMNEELQSTNEELETTNNELRQRTLDLDDVNSFLESILGSLGSGVIVLNRQLAVRVWNRESEELWGLRSDEVEGHPLLNLDIGLPVEQLHQPLLSTASGQTDVTELRVSAINRRGKPIDCDVRISPLRGDDSQPDGVIVLVSQVD